MLKIDHHSESDCPHRRWRTAFLASALIHLLAAVALGVLALAAPTLIHRFVFGPGHRRQVTQFESLAIHATDVVFLGDSITEAVQWHELFPSITTRNRGIGGDTSGEVLARLDPILRGQPRKLFLMVGTNDVRLGRSPDASMKDLETILERLQQEAPGTAVYVESVLPRSARYAARIRAHNRRLEQVAQRHAATYLDLFDSFADERGAIRPEYSNDDLHLLGPGIQLWARLLAPYVLDDTAQAHPRSP
ncbi:MAG: GDSL-type esterase/lipase family protein [bacterium]